MIRDSGKDVYFYTCVDKKNCITVKRSLVPLDNPRCPNCGRKMEGSKRREKLIITK